MNNKIDCIIFLILSVLSHTFADVCCTPDQWESFLFVDYGNVFIDDGTITPKTAISLINGTLKISYDYTNQRLYMFLNGTEYSPLIPKPVVDTSLMLYDYKNGIQYEVSANGECDKTKLDTNMTKQCVPDGAAVVSKGRVGTDRVAEISYTYSQTDPLILNVAATVTEDSCIPLHVIFYSHITSSSGSGIMCNLEALDVTPGIRDPSIFDVPEPCRTVAGRTTKRKSKSMIKRFLHDIM